MGRPPPLCFVYDRAAVPPFRFLSRQKRQRLQSGKVDGSTPGGEIAAAAAAVATTKEAAWAAAVMPWGEAEAEAGTPVYG